MYEELTVDERVAKFSRPGRPAWEAKLLAHGWPVIVFADGLGQTTAMAVRPGESLDRAVREFNDPDAEKDPYSWVEDSAGFAGPVEVALEQVVGHVEAREAND
jgi:hypothetical protein